MNIRIQFIHMIRCYPDLPVRFSTAAQLPEELFPDGKTATHDAEYMALLTHAITLLVP